MSFFKHALTGTSERRGDRICVHKHNDRNVSGRKHGGRVLSDTLFSDKKAFFIKMPESHIETCTFFISGPCVSAKTLYYVRSENTFSGCWQALGTQGDRGDRQNSCHPCKWGKVGVRTPVETAVPGRGGNTVCFLHINDMSVDKIYAVQENMPGDCQ